MIFITTFKAYSMERAICTILFLCTLYSLSGQKTLFTLLPAEQTGVDFVNEVVDTKEHNILIYSNYYGGGGVGVGDFNRDGLPDLYFAGNLVGDRLYLNEGDLKFRDVTESAGILNRGGWSSGVAVLDVNNDGWEDIYVTKELYDEQPELRRNELYINNGDGTFTEKAADYGIDSDARTRHALFFDYDKDGWQDLYLLNHPPNAGNYSDYLGIDEDQEIFASRLYRNDGAGKFTDVTQKAGVFKTGYPNSASATDLNNDGWTDLYVANDFAKPDWLFLNNGDGTFTNVIDSVTRHISYFSMGVDAADINNDGWTDVMVLDMQAEDNFRIKSNMSGMDPAAFWKVVSDGGHYQYMFNALHLNQGARPGDSKHFDLSDIAQLAGVSNTDWSWSNLIADFDNDGWKDLFITNGLLRDIRNTDADKNFSKYVQKVVQEFIKKNPNAGEVSIWDILDLEEALEIMPSVPLHNYAYKNNGDLTFTKVIDEWGVSQETFSNGSAYADLDQDGDLDLVINNINEPAYIYRNDLDRRPSANFLRVRITDRAGNRSPFGVKVKAVAGGVAQWYEFTNVRGMYSTSEPVAHFGLGQADEVEELTVIWWDGRQTTLKDTPANQVLTIDYRQATGSASASAAAAKATFADVTEQLKIDYRHEENAFDDYAKQVLLPHKMSQFGPALAVGDVNGDGLEDVYVGGAAGKPGRLFVQRANGFRGVRLNAFALDQDSEDIDATFLDYDNDGDLDLYVVSGGNAFAANDPQYQDRLYENNGSGVMTRDKAALPVFMESGACVRPFDMDGDGDLDLFVGGRHKPWDYPAPTASRILENRDGRYQDVTIDRARDLMSIGMVTDAHWIDYDQDGLTDLMIVGEWMPITIFRQTSSGKFERPKKIPGLEDTEGWWFSLTAGDLDNDGDEDFIVGNLGLNYKYKASPEEPFEVYYNDFDENGSRDIVLSYYNYGKKYPLRGRSCSSQQVPLLKEKFPTYNLFAAADLESVYQPEALEEALDRKASTFASIYLENLGDGRFARTELPNEAQLSSINAAVIQDFDGDGWKDALVAGNLFVSEVETPRNDAGVGLLLRGDGQGGFTAVSPAQSGVFLPYDVKKMQWLHTKKAGPVIVVAPNDGKVTVLGYEKGDF